jgi:WD40 repeat protein
MQITSRSAWMAKQTIYTVGGTVQAGGGVYIKRKADDDLLELCRQGEFAFILSSRQVGKSSLMVRTAQQLEKEDIRSVTVDLSAIGVNVSQDEWYLGILNEIQSTLNLQTDIFAWWEQYSQLGPAQRLTNFFRDVLLNEVKEQVVLFFDEIDSTLSIPFSDDFYVALRAVYNARSTMPDFKRLSFVLVGVAAPGDLISDNKRTPFNIGHRVEINDFTLAEALPLAEGLGERAVQVLTWVFQYTSGHPYLTQRLCAHLATLRESVDEAEVASAVERLFTGEQGKQDNNLQFVRDMLSKRAPDVTRVLLIYRDIRSGKRVVDDERSIAKAHLKLSGLVRSERGILRVRNEIYNTVFNPQWVQDTIPKNWQKVALISVSAILGILILGTLAVFVNDYFVGSRRDQHFRSFISASTPEQRLSDLAEIYRREGILSNKDSDLTASQLFYGLSTADDQLALFRIDIRNNAALQSDLAVVVSHLYTTVANVDPEVDNTRLLQTMLDALMNVKDDPVTNSLRNELNAWIAARNSFERDDYLRASANYTVALSFNPNNHALLYERAKVYVALKLYTNALQDLDATIRVARQSAPNIGTPVPTATPTETVSPTPTVSTPNATDAQTTVQINETRSPSSDITSLPAEIDRTPIIVTTPTLEPTLTPTPAPTAVPTYVLPPKYKSNFTTLIEIVNAVQALIEKTPQLQIARQPNADSEYTNLQSYGLDQIVSNTSPPVHFPVLSLYWKTVVPDLNSYAIITWDVSDPNNVVQLATLVGHSAALESVNFSPDGKYVASASDDGTARVWDAATGEEIARMTHDGYVASVAFRPDGKYVASGSGDNTARVWNAATGEEIARMTHDDDVRDVVFSPDGKYVISGSFDDSARVWDAATGEEIARMTYDGYVSSVVFSPDGKYVVSGSSDGTARVWDAATGEEITRMTHDTIVNFAVFSPDGKYVASASDGGTTRVWDAVTGQEISRMTHDGYVLSITFSPDGKYVVSGSSDGTARVWNAITGKEIARMTHDATVYYVVFNPDSKYVVSGSSDGTTRVWDAVTGAEVANLADPSSLPTLIPPTATPVSLPTVLVNASPAGALPTLSFNATPLAGLTPLSSPISP